MNAKRVMLSASLLAAACFSSGCEGLTKTAQGGLVGGGLGAGLGAIAGSGSGNAGKGALIGGLAGTVLGGVVGNDMDQQDKKQSEARLAAAESRPQTVVQQATLGMTEVVQMSQRGVNETVIINQIRNTNSTFQLSNEDINFLTTNGVSPSVISEMQMRRPSARVIHQPAPTVIYREAPPVVYSRPVYVVPPPPPPPVIGAGFTYTRVR